MLKRKLLFLFLLLAGFYCNAQTKTTPAKNVPGRQAASDIAIKMKDTLGLSTQQDTQVYKINIRLHEQRLAVMQTEKNRDSIGVKLQRIEHSRDALYKEVLLPRQFNLYLSKKRNLLR